MPGLPTDIFDTCHILWKIQFFAGIDCLMKYTKCNKQKGMILHLSVFESTNFIQLQKYSYFLNEFFLPYFAFINWIHGRSRRAVKITRKTILIAEGSYNSPFVWSMNVRCILRFW